VQVTAFTTLFGTMRVAKEMWMYGSPIHKVDDRLHEELGNDNTNGG
jgi:hypothetical protein